MSEQVALLTRLVEFPSVSGDEAGIACLVSDWLKQQGFSPQRHGNNVLCEVGSGSPRLLLHSHLDTVPPSSGWSGDPWRARAEDGRLIGLGANDAKGCVAALLLAIQRLQYAGAWRQGTVLLALTAEEETGGPGGISSVLPGLEPLDAAVFGEPTGLAPCTAQGGMLLLTCTAQGSSGHVAHALRLGLTNAIHRAARAIVALDEHHLPEWLAPDGKRYRTQAQVTLISGGISANQVPDRCEFQLDLRTTPNLNHASLLSELSDLLDCEVSCRSQRYVPVQTAADEAIVRAALAASGLAAHYSSTVSDWSLLPGIPAVKLGPGESERSHRPDEYLKVSELAAGVDCYTRLVQLFF